MNENVDPTTKKETNTEIPTIIPIIVRANVRPLRNAASSVSERPAGIVGDAAEIRVSNEDWTSATPTATVMIAPMNTGQRSQNVLHDILTMISFLESSEPVGYIASGRPDHLVNHPPVGQKQYLIGARCRHGIVGDHHDGLPSGVDHRSEHA